MTGRPFSARAAVALAALTLATAPTARAGAEADGAAVELHGGWVASAGAGVFRGRWTAQALPGDANTVQGTWTLVNGSDDDVMSGTWSARKDAHAWRGTWMARAQDGQVFAGTWQARPAGLRGRKTFQDMLQQSATTQISGSWRAGTAHGDWWLKGSAETSR